MQIRAEIYIAMERLGAPPRLLAVIGSWGDTLSDEAVLALLKEWNETGQAPETIN
jgi:hypothetical protein